MLKKLHAVDAVMFTVCGGLCCEAEQALSMLLVLGPSGLRRALMLGCGTPRPLKPGPWFSWRAPQVSSTDSEHCRRFLRRWCGRLLRQVGGSSRLGLKAFCAFLAPCKSGLPTGEGSLPGGGPRASGLPPRSSRCGAVNEGREGRLRLLERGRGSGSQRSELKRLARRLCWGLLNMSQ